MDNSVKLTKIPVGTILALQDLADSRGCSMESVLQDAVNTEVGINLKLELGCEILCRDVEGIVTRLVFTHMDQ